jgi:large subunit ribosomal protein L33
MDFEANVLEFAIFDLHATVCAMSQDLLIRLQCTECKSYNYHTRRNIKRQDGIKLERSKYCNSCRKHTVHKEKAKK